MLENLPSRMAKKIDADSGECWNWTGAVTSRGYGSFSHGGKIWSTHRLAYVLLVGPIPDGLTIDHLCRNKLCCNPKHLEPVTARENQRRDYVFRFPGHTPRGPRGAELRKLMTVDQAAQHIRASVSVIRAAVASGALVSYPTSVVRRDDYRLKEAEVDAWLESRRWEPAK